MKQKTTTAHSGLQSFGRVIGFFLLTFFITVVPIFAIMFSVSRTLLTQKYLEKYFTDGVVRSEILAFAQVQMSSASLSEGPGSTQDQAMQSAVATSPAVKNFLDTTVSESTYNTVIHTVLSNVFGYLRGDIAFADIKIDTKDLQKSVLSGLQKGITQLPVCGPNEISILDQGDQNDSSATTALCKPKGKTDAELLAFTKNPEFEAMLTKDIPATYQIKDLPNFEDVNYQATQVRHYYNQLQASLIYGGIVLILALIIGSFLWHQHLWYGLQTLGMTVFIPLAGLAALAGFGENFLARLVANQTITQDPTGVHVVNIGWHVIQPLLSDIFNVSAIAAAFGLVIFVIMEIIRHVALKRGLNVHQAGALPEAVKPKKLARK